MVTGLALANWLADAAVLAVSIQSVGATVPWHVLLLIYGSGVAAQSLTITPGGVGATEGTLGLTLVAAGLRPGPALAAVLLYRLVSFWLVASAGGWSSSGCGATFSRSVRHQHTRTVNPGPRQAHWRGGAPS
jgi:hypothetical protein